MELDTIVKSWHNRCIREETLFATTKTTRAIYDRVAVKSENDKTIVVEFVKKVRNVWRVVTEAVFVRDLIDFRYYKD